MLLTTLTVLLTAASLAAASPVPDLEGRGLQSRAVQVASLHSNYRNNKCLVVPTDQSWGPGKPLRYVDCAPQTGSSSQTWEFDRGTTTFIKPGNTGFCLSACAIPPCKPQQGQELVIAACSGTPGSAAAHGSSWTWSPCGQIKLAGTNLCLDNAYGRYFNAHLWTCAGEAQNANQVWLSGAQLKF